MECEKDQEKMTELYYCPKCKIKIGKGDLDKHHEQNHVRLPVNYREID